MQGRDKRVTPSSQDTTQDKIKNNVHFFNPHSMVRTQSCFCDFKPTQTRRGKYVQHPKQSQKGKTKRETAFSKPMHR